jgi:hypothetical protein
MLDDITIAVRNDDKEVIISLMSAQYDIPTKTWYVRTMETKYVDLKPAGSVMACGHGNTLEAAIEQAATEHMVRRKDRGW